MFAVRVPGQTFVLSASQVFQQASIRVQSLWRAGTARLVARRGDGWLRTPASGTSRPAARTRSSTPASFATLQTHGMPASARNRRDDVLAFASFRLQSIDTVLRVFQDGFPSQPSLVISIMRLTDRDLRGRISMGIGHRTRVRAGKMEEGRVWGHGCITMLCIRVLFPKEAPLLLHEQAHLHTRVKKSRRMESYIVGIASKGSFIPFY